MNAQPRTSPQMKGTHGPLRVVCGIDASAADEAVVREACDLAGGDGHVALVCVVHSRGLPHRAQPSIPPARASAALERAMKQTRAVGVRSSVYMLHGDRTSDALLRAAGDGDALVVGSHGASRARGIALGGVATYAVHRAPVPVLVARQLVPEAEPSIVLASDGSPGSDGACTLASRIAARNGFAVTVFTVHNGGDDSSDDGVGRQASALAVATGREPAKVTGHGRPADAIVQMAAESRCRLLVVGSRGRAGLSALGSVSERVAHRAPCSVLVARPHPAP